MKKLLLPGIIGLLFTACSPKPDPATADWMPLRLEPDSTQIYLEDYLMDAHLLDSFSTPTGIQGFHDTANHQLLLVGSLNQNKGLLHFYTQGEDLVLLLQKSFKQEASLFFPDSSHQFREILVAGEFNGWTPSRDAMTYNEATGNWELHKKLNQGQHAYRLHIDGEEQLDPNNPLQKENGLGGFNSVWQCGKVEIYPAIRLSFAGINEFTAAMPGEETRDSLRTDWFILYKNHLVKEASAAKLLSADASGLGILGNGLLHVHSMHREALVPVKGGHFVTNSEELTRDDRHAMIMYFMMLDRFYNGDTSNDPMPLDSVLPIAQFLGGDLKGLKHMLDLGYFDDLNVNTLWISPISPNPEDAWGLWDKGGVRTRFSSYHGYWPTAFAGIDHRFGKEEDLSALIRNAHVGNKNVILDYVAHHVHKTHPLFAAHPDWVTTLNLPDGTLNTERWDEYRLTTWFDVFLPTLDMARPEVCEAVTDSAMYWFRTFDLDGLRHDATKHVPNEYWRMLTRKLRTQAGKNREHNIYQIGETYGSAEMISSYLGSGLMDAQFDFNLYDAALGCFAFDKDSSQEAQAYENLASALYQSLQYYGEHHLMGNISGNQDKPRFVSLADGSVKANEDTKLAGYTRNIQHQDTVAFRKLKMMMAFNYMVPGIPIVYYGDEIGMPGANDPDNRRMMRFDSLDVQEESLKSLVSELGEIRSGSMALMYGSTDIHYESDYIKVVRRYGQETVVAFWSKSGAHCSFIESFDNEWEILAGDAVVDSDSLTLRPNGFVILKSIR